MSMYKLSSQEDHKEHLRPFRVFGLQSEMWSGIQIQLRAFLVGNHQWRRLQRSTRTLWIWSFFKVNKNVLWTIRYTDIEKKTAVNLIKYSWWRLNWFQQQFWNTISNSNAEFCNQTFFRFSPGLCPSLMLLGTISPHTF